MRTHRTITLQAAIGAGRGSRRVAVGPAAVCRHRRPGAMLLEIILALTLLFVSMAIIGIQINAALSLGYRSERTTQALMLAEAKLGLLDSGAIAIEREIDGDFGKSFPGYFWRFYFEENDDIIDMWDVTLEILYGTPEEDLEPGNIEDAEVVCTLHTMRPTPALLNLPRDFGVTDEKMDELLEQLPPGLMDASGELNRNLIPSLSVDELMEVFPLLMGVVGAGFGFTPDQIQQAIEQGGLDPNSLPDGILGEGQQLRLDRAGGEGQGRQ